MKGTTATTAPGHAKPLAQPAEVDLRSGYAPKPTLPASTEIAPPNGTGRRKGTTRAKEPVQLYTEGGK